MRKLIIFVFICILLVGNVYAGAFATIGMKGLSFVNPEVAQVVSKAICVSNPILCLKGKVFGIISGKIYENAYEVIAEATNPETAQEVAKAFSIYNQIKGYIDTGAEIIEELEIDDGGYVVKGSMEFKEDEQIGNLVGPNLKKNQIGVANSGFMKEEGITTFTIREKGYLKIRTEDKEIIYKNIKSGGILKLNEEGNVIEADITSDEYGGNFIFGNEIVGVPPDTRLVYKDGQIKVYGKGKSFKLSQSFEGKVTGSNEITILEGESVTIIGNRVIGKSFEGEGFSVKALGENFGEVTFSGGKIVNIGESTNAVINGIEHKTFKGDLNIYYGEVFDASLHKNENYFNYGKDRILLGGNGFTSRLRKGNEIFPEYIENMYDGSYSEREGRLEFTLKGGNLEVIKASTKGRPLAVDINSNGNFEIKNGKWTFDTDGTNIFSKIDKEPPFPIATDMRFNYLDNEGNTKVYDLDISSMFSVALTPEDKARIRNEMVNLKNLKKRKEEELNFLEGVPEIKKISKRIDGLTKEIRNSEEKMEYLGGQLERAERAGTPEQITVINEKIERVSDEYAKIIDTKEDLLKNSDYKKIFIIKQDIKKINSEIEDKQYHLETGVGETEIGVFGQIIRSQDGDVKVSYSEYIEGFPVIKNTEMKYYYGEVYRPDLGYTVGGQRLAEPKVEMEDVDIFELIVDSQYQTCADTPVELRVLWELEEVKKGNRDKVSFVISNGESLEYRSDGTYTVWSEKEKKVVTRKYGKNLGKGFDKWVSNVQAYTNTGSLRKVLEPVTEVNNLKPGDIITLHPDPKTGYGHTVGIKEILEIPPGTGRIYYRTFSGFDPASDARIYPELYSQDELIKDLERGNIILTWKNG
jgi:hypothetical protein